VSVWTSFPETKLIQQSWTGGLPFKSSWKSESIYLVSQLFLERLIDYVYGEGNARPFISDLLELRYCGIIRDNAKLFSNSSLDAYCRRLRSLSEQERQENSREEHNRSSSHHHRFCASLLRLSLKTSLPSIESDISRIEKLGKLFRKVGDPARREIWLQHFCEQFAFAVVSNVEQVPNFLADFASDC